MPRCPMEFLVYKNKMESSVLITPPRTPPRDGESSFHSKTTMDKYDKMDLQNALSNMNRDITETKQLDTGGGPEERLVSTLNDDSVDHDQWQNPDIDDFSYSEDGFHLDTFLKELPENIFASPKKDVPSNSENLLQNLGNPTPVSNLKPESDAAKSPSKSESIDGLADLIGDLSDYICQSDSEDYFNFAMPNKRRKDPLLSETLYQPPLKARKVVHNLPVPAFLLDSSYDSEVEVCSRKKGKTKKQYHQKKLCDQKHSQTQSSKTEVAVTMRLTSPRSQGAAAPPPTVIPASNPLMDHYGYCINDSLAHRVNAGTPEDSAQSDCSAAGYDHLDRDSLSDAVRSSHPHFNHRTFNSANCKNTSNTSTRTSGGSSSHCSRNNVIGVNTSGKHRSSANSGGLAGKRRNNNNNNKKWTNDQEKKNRSKAFKEKERRDKSKQIQDRVADTLRHYAPESLFDKKSKKLTKKVIIDTTQSVIYNWIKDHKSLDKKLSNAYQMLIDIAKSSNCTRDLFRDCSLSSMRELKSSPKTHDDDIHV